MKRFTETEKWNDPWFRRLKPDFKLLWEYLVTRCDNCGVWVVDWDLVTFHIGIQYDENKAKEIFADRIQDIGRSRWWIPKFIRFQFGELNPKLSRVHRSVTGLLQSHGIYSLWIAYQEATGRAQDKDQSQDKDKDKDFGKGTGENPLGGEIPSIEQVKAAVMTSGIPEGFVEMVYSSWIGRSGRDGSGVAVEIIAYVRKRWCREGTEWRAGNHREQKGVQVNGHKSTNPNNRNSGTTNENRTGSYSAAAARALAAKPVSR